VAAESPEIPVVGATVTMDRFSGATDAGGRVTFADVPEGTYTISITHPDYEKLSRTVSVPADFPLTLTLIRLIKYYTVTIQVLG